MAKRVTNEQAHVEYRDADNNHRVTSEQAHVEYVDTDNYIRATQVLVMVEYVSLTTGRVLGPAVQIM